MKQFFVFAALAASLITFGACNNSDKTLAEKAEGDINEYESGYVDAIEQARPTIMVLPSDNLLKRYNALSTQNVDGHEVYVRDYDKYLKANADNKAIISAIQDAFVKVNYPLQDLDQALKKLGTSDALDIADDLSKDAKTMLLSVTQPDIIIELDYKSSMDMREPVDKARSMSYTINAIDAYSSSVISSVTKTDLKGGNIAAVMNKSIKESMPQLLSDIQKSFSETLKRGRNITIRVAIATGSNIDLSDESIEGNSYADWVIDYVKTHTVKGAYKMQNNTSKEMSFVNCRIRLLNDDGTQYGAYDWAREMSKAMKKELGVSCTNQSQGLGEVLITINGLK